MALVSYEISESSGDENDLIDKTLQPESLPSTGNSVDQQCENAEEALLDQSSKISGTEKVPSDTILQKKHRTHPIKIYVPPIPEEDEEQPRLIQKPTSTRGLLSLLPKIRKKRKFEYPSLIVRNSSNMKFSDCGSYVGGSNEISNFLNSPDRSSAEADFQKDLDGTNDEFPALIFHSVSDTHESDFRLKYKIPVATITQEVEPNFKSLLPKESLGESSKSKATELEDTENDDYRSLNPDELVKLCGSHGRRLSADGIKVIEINETVGPETFDMEKNYVKNLISHSPSSFHQNRYKCSRIQRAKNHITYLTEHAKLCELEIQHLAAYRHHNKRKSQERKRFWRKSNHREVLTQLLDARRPREPVPKGFARSTRTKDAVILQNTDNGPD